MQSRYYNPTWGRFINADSFTSTGQGILGNNMFAYCLNNPVNLVDPGGTIPFSDGFFDENFRLIGEWIGNKIRELFDEERHVAQELTYTSYGEKKGAQIIDSYKVNNPFVMYEYIHENRGDEISGTTTGVVVEWGVHNIAYTAGKYINHLGFSSVGNSLMLKGQTLDIGSTIYDDSHGVASVAMWLTYYGSAPFLALYDLAVKLFD